MPVIWGLILGFPVLVFLITLINALTAPMVAKGPRPGSHPLVSVLVPARNEEENIGGCLDSLLRQDYPNFEILVLDDRSSDRTGGIVRQAAAANKRIRCLDGTNLPDGWTGKNWACHQLAQSAGGEILLFTDADNRFSPDAVGRTVGWMEKLKLDLFSAFPEQQTLTWPEKLVVPSVYMTVYCYLPLWLTYFMPHPSLAAANGQWMAFTRASYDRLGGHESAAGEIVEDTFMARLAKKKKMKILTAAGTGAVRSRMYHNWSEIRQGFSKNLFGLMDYRLVPFLSLLFLMFAGYVLPYGLVFSQVFRVPAGIAVIVNILIRGILAFKYRDPWITVPLHPLAILLTIFIGLDSVRVFRRGSLDWKGRKINFR